MSENEPSRQEGTDDAPTKTERRAEWEGFEFRVPIPGSVRVENVSYGAESDEHVYVVSVEGGIPFDCTCPAWEYHNPDDGCKHMVAVENRPAVTRAASSDASAASGQQVATDGGTQQVARTDDTESDDNQTDATDGETRPQTDQWGQEVTHFDDEAVGAGEKSECQSCGSRFEIAMIAATADNTRNWEEFYECQSCGARGSFHFYGEGETDRREWTGRIAYPEDSR